jgi:hypothetical protein
LLSLFGKIDSLVFRDDIISSKLELKVAIGLLGKLNLLPVLRVLPRVHGLLLLELFDLLLAHLSLKFALLTLTLSLSFMLLSL